MDYTQMNAENIFNLLLAGAKDAEHLFAVFLHKRPTFELFKSWVEYHVTAFGVPEYESETARKIMEAAIKLAPNAEEFGAIARQLQLDSEDNLPKVYRDGRGFAIYGPYDRIPDLRPSRNQHVADFLCYKPTAAHFLQFFSFCMAARTIDMATRFLKTMPTAEELHAFFSANKWACENAVLAGFIYEQDLPAVKREAMLPFFKEYARYLD